MAYGFGRGFGFGGGGFRGGMGFGFRGSSPPWPYVGIGRGGLPRHGYFFSGAAGALAFGNVPFAPQVTPEQEIEFLRNQAEAISEQLEQIEARIQQLGSES
jgi:hypothetical protein